MKNGYVDFYLLSLPKKHLAAYKKIATRFGNMSREYGALDYCETVGDDLMIKGCQRFTKAVTPKPGEVVIAAYVTFKNKAQRDKGMKQMTKDPRFKRLDKEMTANPLTDMRKMYYGGFKTIVSL